jgi:hypothetical protein
MSRLSVLLSLALSIIACDMARSEDFEAVAAERAQLAAGLLSYTSPSAARQSLGVDPTRWTLLEDTKYEGGSWRPPYRMQIVLVSDQAVDDTRGDLELRFFNDRLMETYFCPDDYTRSLPLLAKRYPGIATTQALSLGNHVELRIGPSASGKQCVIWRDLRLQGQLDRWIRAYS